MSSVNFCFVLLGVVLSRNDFYVFSYRNILFLAWQPFNATYQDNLDLAGIFLSVLYSWYLLVSLYDIILWMEVYNKSFNFLWLLPPRHFYFVEFKNHIYLHRRKRLETVSLFSTKEDCLLHTGGRFLLFFCEFSQ